MLVCINKHFECINLAN